MGCNTYYITIKLMLVVLDYQAQSKITLNFDYHSLMLDIFQYYNEVLEDFFYLW